MIVRAFSCLLNLSFLTLDMGRGSLSQLFHLRLSLEWRERNGLYNTLLYALATSYIASLVVGSQPGVGVWSGLMWFLMLFNSITASSGSFRNEGSNRYTYYFQIARPHDLFISHWIYNLIYGLIVVTIQFLLLVFFIGSPSDEMMPMFIQILMGSIGLMGVLSLTSAIAALSDNNVSLMAILSFPLLIPVLIIGLRGTVLAGL